MKPAWLQTRHAQSAGIIAGMAGVISVGFVDYITTPEINMFIFYLLLIASFSWFFGKQWGTAIAVACAAVWTAAEWRHGLAYSHPFIVIWKVLVNPGIFLIFNHTLWSFRKRLDDERVSARRDFLTGLGNRRDFCERAEVEMERARRSGQPTTVAYLDLDNFKEVNDRLGHAMGDRALREVAKGLAAHLRLTDIAARMGGDEFAILLPDTDAASARATLLKLQELLLWIMKQNGWPVTFSIGAVTFLVPPSSVEGMLQRADHFMYDVKANGKNTLRHEVYEKH